MKSCFVLQYSTVKNLTINCFISKLKDTPGIKLKSLKIKDLSDIYPGLGVYIFKQGKKFYYVGKVSSMSFVERIPKHFDLRESAWMNRLLKIICEKQLNKEINYECLKNASKFAFNNLNLVLINFEENWEKISRIERLLRSTNEPLNSFKTIKIEDQSIIINKY